MAFIAFNAHGYHYKFNINTGQVIVQEGVFKIPSCGNVKVKADETILTSESCKETLLIPKGSSLELTSKNGSLIIQNTDLVLLKVSMTTGALKLSSTAKNVYLHQGNASTTITNSKIEFLEFDSKGGSLTSSQNQIDSLIAESMDGNFQIETILKRGFLFSRLGSIKLDKIPEKLKVKTLHGSISLKNYLDQSVIVKSMDGQVTIFCSSKNSKGELNISNYAGKTNLHCPVLKTLQYSGNKKLLTYL